MPKEVQARINQRLMSTTTSYLRIKALEQAERLVRISCLETLASEMRRRAQALWTLSFRILLKLLVRHKRPKQLFSMAMATLEIEVAAYSARPILVGRMAGHRRQTTRAALKQR